MTTPYLRTPALIVAGIVLGAGLTVAWIDRASLLPVGSVNASLEPRIREFDLTIQETDLDMGQGAVWHAWTYNGTVPGPTLTATVGDVLRITVHNTMNLTHSFHSHLSPYSLENDGSQLNTITGIGGMAMIPPGGTYTYQYRATIAGLFYYHCHSADGDHTISQHMAQGLYGAVIVKAPEEVPIRDEVVFMAERGFNVTGNAPFFLMNGKGLAGGEHKLEEVHHAQGMAGVQAQFGVTVPVIHGKVGEPIRLSIVNIGDMPHSFHMHAMTMYWVDHDGGQPVPAQVVGLIPGEADRVIVTPNAPGAWLFHCHVVSHADGGMIGVFLVDPANA